MKKNNRLIYILLLFLLSVDMALIIKNFRLKQEITKIIEGISDSAIYYDLLRGNMSMYYSYNETPLADFIVKDRNKNEFKLSQLLDKEYKLIYKYSNTNCFSCIEIELQRIEEVAKRISKERILILAEYSNMREFTAFIEERKLDLPIYYIKKEDFKSLVLEKENVPFVCLLNKDLKISHLFIPIKEIPGHSKRYYSIIYKKFFSGE